MRRFISCLNKFNNRSFISSKLFNKDCKLRYSTSSKSNLRGRFKNLEFIDVEEAKGLFSVVSYNLSCNPFANLSTLPQLLGRTTLVINELDVYNADIICLQEVDYRVYEKLFCNYFDNKGYEHHIHLKDKSKLTSTQENNIANGCVIAYKKSKFTNIEFKDIEIRQILSDKSVHKFGVTPHTFQKIMKRSEIMTIALLETTHLRAEKKKLCVANTQLMITGGSDALSTVQAHCCTHTLTSILDKNGPMALLFCGYFSSSPRGGTYKYLRDGYMNHNSLWMKINNLSVTDINFTNDLELKSAYGQTELGEPNFTQYKSPDNNLTSDYIWYNPLLKLSRVLKIDEERVKKHKSLPSLEFPSEHLALMAEFAFVPPKNVPNYEPKLPHHKTNN